MNTALNFLAVGAGGFFGAMARYGVALAARNTIGADYPLGTLVANLTGAFLLGLFLTVALERTHVDPRWQLFIATGILGGYTTFSTFEFETFEWIKLGGVWWAIAYVFVSVLGGLLAVVLGVKLAQA